MSPLKVKSGVYEPVFEAVTRQVNIEIFAIPPTPLPLLVQAAPETPVIDHVAKVALGL